MNKDKAEFIRLFQRDLLNSLTENDGENFRELLRYAKKSKSKQVKKDMEKLCRHPALKPLVPH
jgi:hypothetical protein